MFKRETRKKIKRVIIIFIAIIISIFIIERIYNGRDEFQVTAEDASYYGILEAKLTTREKLHDFDYLYDTLEQNYPFLKVNERLHGIDWLENKKKYRRIVKNTKNDAEFFVAIDTMLRDLNNGHVNIFDGRGYRQLNKMYYEGYARHNALKYLSIYEVMTSPFVMNRYKYNRDMEEVVLYEEPVLETRVLIEDEVAYMKIKQMAGFELVKEDHYKIRKFLETVEDYEKIIIDIRGNGGGYDEYWENIVRLLTDEILKVEYYSFFKDGHRQNRDPFKVQIAMTIRCDDEYLETENFKKDLIKIVYGLYDNWIVEGLYKKIFDINTETIDFSKYYEDHKFSLFGARFFEPFSSEEEIDNIESACLDLIEYLLKSGEKMDLLENNIETSDMEDWAKDRNIDLSYQKEIESLMNIEVMKNETKLIINTEKEINGFSIEIPHEGGVNEQYDKAEKIEQIILRFNRDIVAIKKGIEKDAPNFYKDYEEVLNNVPKLKYLFDDTISQGGLYHRGLSTITLNYILTQPHEYCHFLFHDPFMRNGIIINKPWWLDEGIVQYLNIVYSEVFSEVMEVVFDEMNDMTSDYLEISESDLLKIKAVINDEANIMRRNDIDPKDIKESVKDKNKKLILNDIIFLGDYKSYKLLDTIEKLEDDFNEKASSGLMSEKDNMDYSRNFSFMSYIIEEYGLEKILYLSVADFKKQTYEEVFGKSFDELESDWINHLKENIKDIELLL